MSDETVTSFREGHAACPFVAFEDDRDHRADHPDYRHRCFAAADAAGEPRALPHQERFCLSAAFAQCPIFLDWARQEAARPVDKNLADTADTEVLAAGAASTVASTPAFLAGRGRTTPAELTPASSHSADPGSGLWGFEGAPKRTIAPTAAPVRTTPSTPVVAMAARREPTRPAWENPPRMDNFPRLRAREDRSSNQPLLLAAMGVAALMVALIAFGQLSGGGGSGANNNPSHTSSHAPGASDSGPIALVTDTPIPTPQAERTLQVYLVSNKDKSLTGIANKFGISLAQLELANPLGTVWKDSKSYDIIFPGLRILIPWPEWTPPPPPPTPTPSPSPTPKPTPTPKATPTPAGP
jgi:hypothetical protein